jgi:hypothetical protein
MALLRWVNGTRSFEETYGFCVKGSRDSYFGHFIYCRLISNTNFLRLHPLLSSYIKDVNVGSKELFSLTGQRLLY